MTPQQLERQLAGELSGGTIVAAVTTLERSGEWQLAEITVAGTHIALDLVYLPTGAVSTLTATRLCSSAG